MIWRTRSDRLYSGAVRGMTGQVRSGQTESDWSKKEGMTGSSSQRSGQDRQTLLRGREGDVRSGQECMTYQESDWSKVEGMTDSSSQMSGQE